MALIVEDGTGRADAEAYVSVAEADTYHLNRGNAVWAPLTGTVKEQLLRKATEYMLGEYGSRWASFRTTSTQALDWPRAWVPLPDAPYGYGSSSAYVPNNIVPGEVKRACAALALIANDGDLAPSLPPTTLKETVGPISVEYDPASVNYTVYRAIDATLKRYLSGSKMNVGLVRT